MKNLLFVFSLLLGFNFFADNNSAQNDTAKTDSTSAVEADTSKIMTS